MDVFRERAWVTQTRGKYRGRSGCVHGVYTGRKRFCIPPVYIVQFGADGPFRLLQHGSLRKADPEDVAFMMGCGVRDLSEDDLR